MSVSFYRSLCLCAAMVAAVFVGGYAVAEEPVDTKALAALRPGDTVDALERAMGSHWRAPAAHAEGRVSVLENSHKFTARIDAEGRIGDMRFNSGFDPKQRIEGLYAWMPIAEARAARPDIHVGDEMKMGPPMRFAVTARDDGSLMNVIYNFDHVSEIRIFNPTAVYPAKQPLPYPAPVGEPGAPFADPNLKLVVISRLMWTKHIDLGQEDELAAHLLGRPVDLEEEGYAPIPGAHDYLARYPLTPELLAAVTSLELDGGNEVYSYVEYFWGGETEDYDVQTLEGIGALTNLESLHVISMIGPVDYRPLLDLPKLKRVEGLYAGRGPFGDTNTTVFEALRKRGVKMN